MTPEVVHLDAAGTHHLRRTVLRSGVPATDIEFAEDHWPGAVHLGLRVEGEVVAISSWIPRQPPDGSVEPPPADGTAVQLRGMATAAHLQGNGLGGVLLEAGCAEQASVGRTLVWARARDAALTFYLRHAFEVRGDGFIDTNTRLPHHLVVRTVG